MIEVRVSPEMGRGVYATTDITLGMHIETCELLVLTQIDTRAVNQTDLQYYTFKYSDACDCLVLGIGEMFNHSNRPNVMYSLAEIDGRKVMVFVATRPIQAGEQLFIDYSADIQVDVKRYVDQNLI